MVPPAIAVALSSSETVSILGKRALQTAKPEQTATRDEQLTALRTNRGKKRNDRRKAHNAKHEARKAAANAAAAALPPSQ